MEILPADGVVGASDPTLYQLQKSSIVWASPHDVDGLLVLNALVNVSVRFQIHPAIGRILICVDGALGQHALPNDGKQRSRSHVHLVYFA